MLPTSKTCQTITAHPIPTLYLHLYFISVWLYIYIFFLLNISLNFRRAVIKCHEYVKFKSVAIQVESNYRKLTVNAHANRIKKTSGWEKTSPIKNIRGVFCASVISEWQRLIRDHAIRREHMLRNHLSDSTQRCSIHWNAHAWASLSRLISNASMSFCSLHRSNFGAIVTTLVKIYIMLILTIRWII